MLAIGFCWCYLTGEWQHDRKKNKKKKHGRLSVSLFRYGLDYVQMAILRLIGFGKEEFKKVLAILRKKRPDRTANLVKFAVVRTNFTKSYIAINAKQHHKTEQDSSQQGEMKENSTILFTGVGKSVLIM